MKKSIAGAVWFDISFKAKGKTGPALGKSVTRKLRKAHRLIEKALGEAGFEAGARLYHMDLYCDGNLLWTAE